jgi:hypothetical protein
MANFPRWRNSRCCTRHLCGGVQHTKGHQEWWGCGGYVRLVWGAAKRWSAACMQGSQCGSRLLDNPLGKPRRCVVPCGPAGQPAQAGDGMHVRYVCEAQQPTDKAAGGSIMGAACWRVHEGTVALLIPPSTCARTPHTCRRSWLARQQSGSGTPGSRPGQLSSLGK